MYIELLKPASQRSSERAMKKSTKSTTRSDNPNPSSASQKACSGEYSAWLVRVRTSRESSVEARNPDRIMSSKKTRTTFEGDDDIKCSTCADTFSTSAK